MAIKIILFLASLVIILFFICLRLFKKLRKISFDKKSLSTKYGKITEQFLPFLLNYPYSPSNFRFIGTPVDGIQFEEDKIIFIEFKTATSQLTERQKRIKKLIENRMIKWQEIRIDS